MTRSEPTRRPVLSAEEALALHHDALVIDSQQPPATNGFLFNDNMRAALREYHARGMTQSQAFGRLAAMAAREIQTSEDARLTDDYHIVGYNDFTDWPNITVKLAERGFDDEELRRILGLNYLRVFRDVVG